MRVIGLIVVVVLISFHYSFSQTAVPTQVRAQLTLAGLGSGLTKGDILYGVPLPPGRVVGDTYLNNSWNPAKIMLYGGKVIEGFAVKYDVKEEMLEIRGRNGIKLLEARRVQTLVWADSASGEQRFFVNAGEYREDGAPLTGLLEVISDGDLPLFKKTFVVQKDPTYVPAFNAGTRDTKIMKKEKFYFSKTKNLTKVGGKKTLLTAFGDHSDEVEQFMKSNKLSTNEDDLERIFEFYNSKVQVN